MDVAVSVLVKLVIDMYVQLLFLMSNDSTITYQGTVPPPSIYIYVIFPMEEEYI